MFKNNKIKIKNYNFICICLQNLRVCGNRVLRRISGPKRANETAGSRKLHNEEIHPLFSSPYVCQDDGIVEDRMDEA
jgi:hypothetical protein